MPRARILIKSKPGVFDPEGKVVQSSLERLGHADVSDVRVGKVIDIEFDEGERDELVERIEQMCETFLVNPVIEDFSYEFLEDQ